MKCLLGHSCGYLHIIIVASGFNCAIAARKARLEYGRTSAGQRLQSIKRGTSFTFAEEENQILAEVEQQKSAEPKNTFKFGALFKQEAEDTDEDSSDEGSPKKKWGKFGAQIGGFIKRGAKAAEEAVQNNERLAHGWEVTKAVVDHAKEQAKEASGVETQEQRQARRARREERERERQRELFRLDRKIRKQLEEQVAEAEAAGTAVVWTPPPTPPTPKPTRRGPSLKKEQREKYEKALAKAEEERERQRQEMIEQIRKEVVEEARKKKELAENARERAANRSKEKAEKMKTCKPCGATHVDDRLRSLLCRAELLDYKLPSDTNRVRNACKSTAMQKTMLKHAMSVRPIIHPRVKRLASQFVAHKKQSGSLPEKQLYMNMTTELFLQRLFVKRPVAFFGPSDAYMLRDGTRGQGGFSAIGTAKQRWPLLIEDYLSYEEMEISALVGVSTPTSFINSGARNNNCQQARAGSFEPEGIYIGVVGTRFEVIEKMEWRHMIASKSQNVEENGYGKNGAAQNPMLSRWAELYGLDYLPTYADALSHRKSHGSSRFYPGNGTKKFQKHDFFDAKVYQARNEITAEMFLAEANERAKASGARAYCQTAGLGLGVWGLHRDQGHIQINAYIAAIKRLSLPHVGAIVFRGGGSKTSSSVRDKDGAQISIVRTNRHPAAKLPAPQRGKPPWLLVAQYAWDGNSYPGNEYWMGKKYFKMSGDPAAACSSYIPELQNPEVNVEAFDPSNVHVVPLVEPRPSGSTRGDMSARPRNHRKETRRSTRA